MINYPFNITNFKEKTNKKPDSHKNRGLSLEKLINDTNKFYIFNEKALIYKKPTPIHVVKTNKENIITEAYFEKPSTTDYNGLYKGKYLDFEAKETKSKTSFPLNNLNSMQIKHLNKVDEMGGIAFIIVSFTSLNRYFLYFIKDLKNYLKSNKKSIPLNEFIEHGHELEISIYPKLDYLKVIDQLF